MNLNELSVGQSAVITEVSGEVKDRKRLLDLGLTAGTEIVLYKRAPLGDPLEIILRGYHLTLRAREAEKIVCRLL